MECIPISPTIFAIICIRKVGCKVRNWGLCNVEVNKEKKSHCANRAKLNVVVADCSVLICSASLIGLGVVGNERECLDAQIRQKPVKNTGIFTATFWPRPFTGTGTSCLYMSDQRRLRVLSPRKAVVDDVRSMARSRTPIHSLDGPEEVNRKLIESFVSSEPS